VTAQTAARDWLTLARPRQWIKNTFVLAPLVFSGNATDPGRTLTALLAAGVFCLLSSAVYAMNDALDSAADRAHPQKRLRPVAAGRIPPGRALGAGGILSALATGGAFWMATGFGWIAVAYVSLNLLYTWQLKSMVIVDVFVIASFFIMRLVGGAVVIDVPYSVWLLLCGGLLALYLGFTKRRHELVMLGELSGEHRPVLVHYTPIFLDQMSSVLLSVTVVAYIMYTLNSETAQAVGSDWLSYSVVFVLYGVFRYLYLVHRRGGGSPTETLLTDPPLLAGVTLWLAYCGWVIYVGS
jgi:4-hydroxybenzoate polyprenyltransferase